tara:strand:+ start:2728 stop:3636 length:909 start_codon:yes stop_codon:yes gene_type:complete
MTKRKKNIDSSSIRDNFVKEKRSRASKAQLMGVSGLAGSSFNEGVSQFVAADNEVVIEGNNNSSIVLGRDRPSHLGSGYGGLGHTGCGSIDLVVGRPGDSNHYVNPNLFKDAARIQIVQKTDVDSNYGIAEGFLGNTTERSAIAIKADAVRVIGREGVKIISGGDTHNSHGGKIESFSGIEIIANNDDTDLQPMPKGDNLAFALDEMIALVYDLSGILNSFAVNQDAYNAVIMGHMHYSPFYGITVPPSEALLDQGTQTLQNHFQDVTKGLLDFSSNLALFRDTFIAPHGKLFINSKYNKVN